MKKSILFLLSVSMLSYGAMLFAQGKTFGRTPGQAHARITGGQQNGSTSVQSPNAWQARFNQRLQSDPAFKARIARLLPPGTDPVAAETGFKSPGQFIAALHVSKNIGIPFDQLKAKLTGSSNTAPMSLGAAIHELRPTIPVNQAGEEARKAETQATIIQRTAF